MRRSKRRHWPLLGRVKNLQTIYIIGLRVIIETDHKPLVPLLGSKHLDDLPLRILRFRLRLARFDYTIQHVPGKLLVTGDALSRVPLSNAHCAEVKQDQEPEHIMEVCVKHLPATQQRLSQYKLTQSVDPACVFFHNEILQGRMA